MLALPAICQKCFTIFPSGIVGDNSTIVIENVTSGPCPNCGENGVVPNGYYKIKESIIDVVLNSSISLERFKSIIEAIEIIRKNKDTPETVAKNLHANVSEFDSIWDILPKTKAELYAFLSLIITILTFAFNFYQSSITNNLSLDYIKTTLNEIIEEKIITKEKNSPYIAPHKTGRNELCLCGSGKKYKNCCGIQT